MKQKEFDGWVKKAYPGQINSERRGEDIWYSTDHYVQVIAKSNGSIEFRRLGPNKSPVVGGSLSVTDSAEIVKNIRSLWGEPAVAFEERSPKKEEPKPEEPKPEPKQPEPQPKAKAVLAPEKEGYTREKVLATIKEVFPDAAEKKVPGGIALSIGSSPRLVLYDLGISTSPSEFIPWGRTEDVKELLNTIFKCYE